jgi:hypothetical protein
MTTWSLYDKISPMSMTTWSFFNIKNSIKALDGIFFKMPSKYKKQKII